MAQKRNEFVKIIKEEGNPGIRLSGQIWKPDDLSLMRNAFSEVLQEYSESSGTLLIEMENLSFLSSRGIGYIAELYSNARDQGIDIVISNPQPHILELLELSELHRLLSIVKR